MNIKALIEHIHRKQKRKTGEPYTSHLYAVREILQNEGITNQTTLNAALLHDSIEDCPNVTREYLATIFGKRLAEIVAIISKNQSWNTRHCQNKNYVDTMEASWPEYPEVVLIKMADRLHNLRTIEGFNSRKQYKYLKETKELLLPMFLRIIAINNSGDLKKYMESLHEKIICEVENIELRLSYNH